MITLPIHEHKERQRIKINIVYFLVIAAFFLAIFSSLAIFRQDWFLAAGLMLFVLLCVSLAVYTHNTQKIQIPRILTIVFAYSLYFYLLLNGAYQNTGYMWCFTLSPVPYFLLGHIKGLLVSLSVVVLSIMIFFIPDFPLFVADYPEAIKIRFPGAYLAVSILFFVQEYSRHQTDLLATQLTEQLEVISRTDDMTGIPNRRALQEYLQRRLDKLSRYSQPFAMILLDIDHFKQVNDQYGHDVGDQVLIELGQVCSESLRSSDMFGRWGGEEFMVILSQVTASQILPISEKLRQVCKDMGFNTEEKKFSITVSLGAYFVAEYETADVLFQTCRSRPLSC